MPQWLIKLFHSLGRKSAAKRTGIAKIPTQISAEGHGAGLYTQLREAGFTDEALTKLIKSEKDILRLVNKVESIQKQQTKKASQGLASLKKEPTSTKERPFSGWTPHVIEGGGTSPDDFLKLKEDTYRRLMMNTDDAVKAFGKRIINNTQDVKFEKLTKEQRKGIFGLIDDRIKLGNRKFMNKHNDLDVGFDPEDMASGGIARVGYSKGRLAKWLLSLGKKPKINRKLTKDELDDLYEEFDEAVPYPMETVGDKEKFLKAVKDEEAYMFQQYKKGNLDPKPGEPNRKRFLEKKLEEMELSGDKRLMTREEIEELSSFDLGTEMDEAVKKYKQKDIQQKRELQAFDVKDRTKQASGGIAGQLHLNRPGYFKGRIVTGIKNYLRKKAEKKKWMADLDKKLFDKKGNLNEGALEKHFKDMTDDFQKQIDQRKKFLTATPPKGRKLNAEGGIAGELHLNRPGYAKGTREKAEEAILATPPNVGGIMGDILSLYVQGVPKWIISKLTQGGVRSTLAKKYHQLAKENRLRDARQMLTAQDPYVGEDSLISSAKKSMRRVPPADSSSDVGGWEIIPQSRREIAPENRIEDEVLRRRTKEAFEKIFGKEKMVKGGLAQVLGV
jgi:hypothetical protein